MASGASALSSSPRSSPLASRPHWPYSTYSHRPMSSSSRSSPVTASTASPSTPAPSEVVPSGLSSSFPHQHAWQHASAARSGSTVGGMPPALQTDTMRQWNFTAFEWVVRDIHKLRDLVEYPPHPYTEDSVEQDTFEILKETPVLGDQKFKLEIARTSLSEEAINQSNAVVVQTLSLYITSLMMDYPHADEISASMMVAIKCQDDRVGERGARADWVWEVWQNDWIYRQESEFWECTLPSLSFLLEHPRIAETDSFVICIQIHSPTGPFYPQQPSACYVPRDLLDGLEASLDNPNTGDVMFVCLERQPELPNPTSPVVSTPRSRRSSVSSSHTAPHVQFTARKRVIYAHSDILIRRSQYFATMLTSSFLEDSSSASGGRRTYTIYIEEADFITVFWLLKWLYANWLLFRSEDDPKAAVEGTGTGWSARWLGAAAAAAEWDWMAVMKPGTSVDRGGNRDEFESPASLDSASSSRKAASTERGTQARLDPASISGATAGVSAETSSSKATLRPSQAMRNSGQSSTSASRRPASSSTPGRQASMEALSLGSSRTTATALAPIIVSPTTSSKFTTNTLYHAIPVASRQPRPPSIPDPHAHPAQQPSPASALSMYQIAHRYAMPGLADLALEHIMSTITPKSSFPLLLATSVWDDLHGLVEDYVVERWEEVSTDGEFDQCCQEVAAGEWGPDGGKTLVKLFRRLRPPTVAPFARA